VEFDDAKKQWAAERFNLEGQIDNAKDTIQTLQDDRYTLQQDLTKLQAKLTQVQAERDEYLIQVTNAQKQTFH
jgi:chromosome segregation ATPase